MEFRNNDFFNNVKYGCKNELIGFKETSNAPFKKGYREMGKYYTYNHNEILFSVFKQDNEIGKSIIGDEKFDIYLMDQKEKMELHIHHQMLNEKKGIYFLNINGMKEEPWYEEVRKIFEKIEKQVTLDKKRKHDNLNRKLHYFNEKYQYAVKGEIEKLTLQDLLDALVMEKTHEVDLNGISIKMKKTMPRLNSISYSITGRSSSSYYFIIKMKDEKEEELDLFSNSYGSLDSLRHTEVKLKHKGNWEYVIQEFVMKHIKKKRTQEAKEKEKEIKRKEQIRNFFEQKYVMKGKVE